jgi:similar to stage IV sporulation protein
MKVSTFSTLRGYVKIEVRGNRLEGFMNAVAASRLMIWDAHLKTEGVAELTILLPDFFRLRPILKQTGCRMHVQKRNGFPFFLDKLGRRKFFAVGMLAFIVGLYMLSSIVWQVKVEGTVSLSNEEVLRVARGIGIKQYQWKFRLQQEAELARHLQRQLPDIAWVGVEIRGTQMIIRVVESTKPEQRPLVSPRNLIATKNAMITQVVAVKGKPLVSPNMYVRKGQVLISGYIGNEMNSQVVVANGSVHGIVWYTSRVEVPQTQYFKGYTGESFSRFYLVMGNRAIQLTGYGKKPYELLETHIDRKTLHWRQYGLPIGWLTETVMQVTHLNKPLTQEEAIRIGLEYSQADLLQRAGKDAKVVSQKILHQEAQNGKVYMDVYYEVEEQIAIEQPIIGQGD